MVKNACRKRGGRYAVIEYSRGNTAKVKKNELKGAAAAIDDTRELTEVVRFMMGPGTLRVSYDGSPRSVFFLSRTVRGQGDPATRRRCVVALLHARVFRV